MSAKQDAYNNLAERIEAAFSEIDSDICADLRGSDSEYRKMWDEAMSLQDAFPVIRLMVEGDGAVGLTEDEHKAFIRHFNLKRKMEDVERKAIYFRGHMDSFAYLRKVGAFLDECGSGRRGERS